MKIAIVHDWLNTFTGAEKVLEQIAILYPNSDLFTIVDFLDANKILHVKNVYTSFIQKFPLVKKYYRYCLPLMPYAISKFNVSEYDLIISSSHAVAKGIVTRQDQLHICYIHTPIRYAWDLREQYLQESNYKGLKRSTTNIILNAIKKWDYDNNKNINYFISNSEYIRKRVNKCYDRDAYVIYPPVDIGSFVLSDKKEDYYLTASRFVPYKKINLIVEAFSQMPEKKLIVIGDGPDYKKINRLSRDNVSLVGFLEKQKMIEYMQKAKAFVFAAEEDFGILPVEVQACGTPIIAYGKGGVLETVINGKTGIFFKEQSVKSLIDAVHNYEQNNYSFDAKVIRQNAERFSLERFNKEFSEFVNLKFNNFYN